MYQPAARSFPHQRPNVICGLRSMKVSCRSCQHVLWSWLWSNVLWDLWKEGQKIEKQMLSLSLYIYIYASTGVGFSAFNTKGLNLQWFGIFLIPFSLVPCTTWWNWKKQHPPVSRFQHPIVSVSEVGLTRWWILPKGWQFHTEFPRSCWSSLIFGQWHNRLKA